MCRRIVITSGKGGVGKTTFTASIGTALALIGNNVLLIDADIGLNNLDVLMGVDNRIVYDMADVLEGKCRIKQALVCDENLPNLHIMPSAHACSNGDITCKAFRALVDKLSEGFDYILIDCPAGIEQGFHRAVSASSEAIVITTPHISSIRDADKVLNLLTSYKLANTALVVNRARGDLIMSGEMMNSNDIARLLKATLIGVIPEDDGVAIFSQLGRIGENNSISRESFDVIANNIITGRRKIYDPTAQYKGVLGKLKLMLKRA